MNTLSKKVGLKVTDCHKAFKKHYTFKKFLENYSEKKDEINEREDEMFKTNQVFEGTLVAAGWDRQDHVNQSSLYTQDDEDILLEHGLGMKKFKPFLNQKVRIWGDVVSNGQGERRISVKKIIRIIGGFRRPLNEDSDEYDRSIAPAA